MSTRLNTLLFRLCQQFLLALGKVFHVGYVEISVIFNLYIQGTLLMISGCLPFVACVVSFIKTPTIMLGLWTIVLLFYASLYIAGFWWILKHYHKPYRFAFDRCVNDLCWICERCGVSYYAVNIIIFIAWWLGVVGANILLVLLIC